MANAGSRSRFVAILQAVLVVTLWSSSWVLIKFGLRDIPPLTFAGLRYVIAFLVLVPLALSRSRLQGLRRLTGHDWWRLTALGLLLYAAGVGMQFVALSYLPTVTTRLLFSSSSVLVALLSGLLLRERATWLQWCGVLVVLSGVYVYFHPVDVPVIELPGIAAALCGALVFSLAAVVGRDVARSRTISPLLVTAVSMGAGSVTLLATGLVVQGMPAISLRNWVIILWLSLVNTSFTFVLWNRTLQTLTAVESNIITTAMIVEIALLAWVFLDERLTLLDGVGLALVVLGTVLVQLRRLRSA